MIWYEAKGDNIEDEPEGIMLTVAKIIKAQILERHTVWTSTNQMTFVMLILHASGCFRSYKCFYNLSQNPPRKDCHWSMLSAS